MTSQLCQYDFILGYLLFVRVEEECSVRECDRESVVGLGVGGDGVQGFTAVHEDHTHWGLTVGKTCLMFVVDQVNPIRRL